MSQPRKSTRKKNGRPTMATLPAEVIRALNDGTRASTNLVEALSVDFSALLQAACPGVDITEMAEACRTKKGVVWRMQLGGRILARLPPQALRALASHASDIVRGWACYAIAGAEGIELEERLSRVAPFAHDPHLGVREWAWMAVRPFYETDLGRALRALAPWTLDGREGIRRFSVESTRPRGVWCSHLLPLKRDPEQAFSLLEPLRSDPSKYVQNSVANWLNDAAKSRPDAVRHLVLRWLRESDTVPTRAICRRATRSLGGEP
jgi:3-methyladenine DNA glycosylase AlkC